MLAGVLPKNMQNALPGGQNAISPEDTKSDAFESSVASTGIEKYISSPQTLAEPEMGKESHMLFAVSVSFKSASIVTFPTVIVIDRYS